MIYLYIQTQTYTYTRLHVTDIPQTKNSHVCARLNEVFFSDVHDIVYRKSNYKSDL